MCVWLNLAIALAAGGQLAADQVALLFNRKSKPSGELAIHYARVRGIPADHMLALDVPSAETLNRADYDRRVVPRVRAFLRQRGLKERVRCLVTFYDVPIRIGARLPSQRELDLARQLDPDYRQAIESLRTVIDDLDRLGRPGATQEASSRPARTALPGPRELHQVDQRYQRARAAALRGISQINDAARARRLKSAFVRLVERADGPAGIVARSEPIKGLGYPYNVKSLEGMRASIRTAQERINALLAKGLTAPERADARDLIAQYTGLRGLIRHLRDDLRKLRAEATGAAFDSELSLLWWDDYPLDRWLVNLLNLRHRESPTMRALIPARDWSTPILMVSRLDGPSPAVVRRVIDESIEVEKRGLTGTVYIDARGYKKQDGYLAYDRNLYELASLIRTKTKLPVVLDDREALFALGQCPGAALYCGWYSHKVYVDAFDFVPGAVAFHIASSEAVSLRDPRKKYWCKQLLEDGVAATIGPVNEPYLVSFPLPKEFFGLLLTGRYTLVECFYMSKHFNSWKQLLVGDPLYRPFARNPQLAVQDALGSRIPTSKPAPGQAGSGRTSHPFVERSQ